MGVHPTVSVIIPTYNSERTLVRAIESVLWQSIEVAEIIVVDDGSTDGTRQLVTGRFPQVRYLAQANQGVSAARNNGAAVATGDWLAFLDADDQWLPRKMETQWELLRAHPEACFITTGRYWSHKPGPRLYRKRVFRWRVNELLRRDRVHTSSTLIKRAVFAATAGFDQGLVTGEDWELWLRLVNSYPSYGTTEKVVVRHKTPGSLSSDRRIMVLNNIAVLKRWNPADDPGVKLSYRTFRRIVRHNVYMDMFHARRVCAEWIDSYWEEVQRELPFSSWEKRFFQLLVGWLKKGVWAKRCLNYD